MKKNKDTYDHPPHPTPPHPIPSNNGHQRKKLKNDLTKKNFTKKWKSSTFERNPKKLLLRTKKNSPEIFTLKIPQKQNRTKKNFTKKLKSLSILYEKSI